MTAATPRGMARADAITELAELVGSLPDDARRYGDLAWHANTPTAYETQAMTDAREAIAATLRLLSEQYGQYTRAMKAGLSNLERR